jgi:hypothetical protein
LSLRVKDEEVLDTGVKRKKKKKKRPKEEQQIYPAG